MNALEELRQHDQWVLWRTETRGGKPTKVPYKPDGRRAASDDPSTWSSYDQVEAVADRYDGIGFVFSPDDEYVGIDIDNALVDGSLHAEVIELVQTVNSYSEWSPSAVGAHVLAKARKPDGSRSSTRETPWGDELAVYDRGRYFAITGNQLPGAPATIEHRQAEIEALLDRYLPPRNGAGPTAERQRASRRITIDGEAIARVLADHPGLETLSARRGTDDSADTFALACAAARDGLDPDLIEQLVAHRLLRHGDPKGRATAREDWIPRTVARALEAVARERRGEQLGDPLADASAIIGMHDEPIICAVEWRDGVVVLERADGLVLKAASLEALAKYDRLRAAVGAAFGHELHVADGKGASTAVRFVAALRRHFGPAAAARAAEKRVEVWMIELVRVASEIEFEAGEEKASAWQEIDQVSPDDAMSAPGFAEKIVLAHDTTTGDRYLRASWAHEYLRRCGLRGSGEETASLLEALGLEQPNADGRVRGGTIQFRFWVIPAELFGRWSA